MVKHWMRAACVTIGLIAAGCVVQAPPPPPFVQAPPPPPEAVSEIPIPPPVQAEVVVVRPSLAHVWVGGHSAWRAPRRAYVWLPGRWVVPASPRLVWVPGRWERHPRGHVWVEGHWRF